MSSKGGNCSSGGGEIVDSPCSKPKSESDCEKPKKSTCGREDDKCHSSQKKFKEQMECQSVKKSSCGDKKCHSSQEAFKKLDDCAEKKDDCAKKNDDCAKKSDVCAGAKQSNAGGCGSLKKDEICEDQNKKKLGDCGSSKKRKVEDCGGAKKSKADECGSAKENKTVCGSAEKSEADGCGSAKKSKSDDCGSAKKSKDDCGSKKKSKSDDCRSAKKSKDDCGGKKKSKEDDCGSKKKRKGDDCGSKNKSSKTKGCTNTKPENVSSGCGCEGGYLKLSDMCKTLARKALKLRPKSKCVAAEDPFSKGLSKPAARVPSGPGAECAPEWSKSPCAAKFRGPCAQPKLPSALDFFPIDARNARLNRCIEKYTHLDPEQVIGKCSRFAVRTGELAEQCAAACAPSTTARFTPAARRTVGVLGPRHVQLAQRWTPTAAVWLAAAFAAGVYTTEWRAALRFVPFYEPSSPEQLD